MRQLLPVRRELAGAADVEAIYAPPGHDHLRLNFVASLDGAIEIGGRSGPLGGPADKAVFTAMRATTDVVLVGAGTARAENYGPVKLPADALARRRDAGLGGPPPVAVVTAGGGLDPGGRLFSDGAQVIVLTTAGVVAGGRLRDVAAEVVDCGNDRVDPVRAVAELRRRGYRRILCEGGPALAADLLGAGLVDELCLTTAPLLAGPDRACLAGAAEPVRMRIETLLEGDGLLMGRYAVEAAR